MTQLKLYKYSSKLRDGSLVFIIILRFIRQLKTCDVSHAWGVSHGCGACGVYLTCGAWGVYLTCWFAWAWLLNLGNFAQF